MINEQLEQHCILIRTGFIVDATLIASARKPRVETSYSDDAEARWTKKGKAFCYGYQGHLAVDVGHGFILGGHVTAANRPDCLELMNVVGESSLEDGAPVFADKGYASTDNRCDLEEAIYFLSAMAFNLKKAALLTEA